MSIATEKSNPETQSVTSILGNTADAMKVLHNMLDGIEREVLKDCEGNGSGTTFHTDFQAIDLLSQSILEIANVMERVANQLPNAVAIEVSAVVEPIRLEHLRNTITNGLDVALPERSKTTETSISLF